MEITPTVRIAACSFLAAVFAIGMVGNTLVCSVVHTMKNMRTATNLILVNLAVADIIACLSSLPIMVCAFTVDFEFGPGKEVGKAHFLLTVGVGLPLVFCHLLLCVDRYDSVIHPFSRRITKKRMKRITAAIWFASAVLLLGCTILVVFVPAQWLLDEDYQDEHNVIFGQVLNSFGLVVILITLFCMLYSFISLKRGLRKHDQNVVHSLGHSTLEKEMRLSGAAVVLVFSFALTSLPWVVARFVQSTSRQPQPDAFVLCYSLMHSSHAINPLVYAGFMRNFRRAMKTRFKAWLRSVCACCGGNNQIHPPLPVSALNQQAT